MLKRLFYAAKTVTNQLACKSAPSVVLLGLMALIACESPSRRIAVIPRTSATLLSEAEHAGVAHAAKEAGLEYYWNAPMRDDDVQGQLDLLERVTGQPTGGIILFPDETLPFRTAIQRVLHEHIPAVIVGTDLGLPPNDQIAYVLNNEQEGAKLAADYLGNLLHGQGSVAIYGIRPQLTTTSERARVFEAELHKGYP